MTNGLLCGEKSTLAILLGSNTLWGKRLLAEMWMVTSLGIPLLLEVLIDFAGDKKTSPKTVFPWFLAEDNPVIS